MTENEAIKWLQSIEKKYIHGGDESFDNSRKVAISMAISAFTRINQLEAEVERFKKRQKPTKTSGYKIENGKVVFFVNILNDYRYEYKDLEEVVKTLNELLKEAYSKDEIAFALKCKTEDLKTAKSEAIKEFAERLKEDAQVYNEYDEEDEYFYMYVTVDDIDSLVKEMVGDEE